MGMMRIAFTSDLHADITVENRKLLPYLAEEFSRLEPDAVVLAGDIADSLSGWKGVLTHFNEIRVPKFIIPGNHDEALTGQRMEVPHCTTRVCSRLWISLSAWPALRAGRCRVRRIIGMV